MHSFGAVWVVLHTLRNAFGLFFWIFERNLAFFKRCPKFCEHSQLPQKIGFCIAKRNHFIKHSCAKSATIQMYCMHTVPKQGARISVGQLDRAVRALRPRTVNLLGASRLERLVYGALRARMVTLSGASRKNGQTNHSLKKERASEARRGASDARSSFNEWFFRPIFLRFCAKRPIM